MAEETDRYRTVTILERIVESTRTRVAASKATRSLEELERSVAEASPPRGFERALRRPGLAVIAEIKRRSPSAGSLSHDADPAAIARAYGYGGASAVSVLTEPDHFGGSLEDLVTARAACDLPVLRKDFIIDPYQLMEARAHGADAILLIAGILDDHELGMLRGEALGLGLDVLIEVHDEPELERALVLEPTLIGINQRDLKTFDVDTGLAARLRPRVPSETAVVAESGVSSPDQLTALASAGIDAVLIGGHLMSSDQPGRMLEELLRGVPR